MNPLTQAPLVGITWPGYSVFVDFSNPVANIYWATVLDKFREKYLFKGLWLDMNEITNLCDGSCED